MNEKGSMYKIKRYSPGVISLIVLIMVFSGCNLMGLLYPEPTPMIVITPIPETKELNICLGYEPRSLYVYNTASQAEQEVLQAITDGPINVLSNGEKQAVLLADLPALENGSIQYTPVTVAEGDLVANNAGNLVSLEPGVPVFPGGCRSADCVINWDGVSPIQMDQLSVTYTLKEDLQWSDGMPLTADDSVYAFEVAADPATPVNKKQNLLTADYAMLDDSTITWTAVPGLVTDRIENFFWPPLPRHAWGSMSPSDLLNDENVNRTPLSYGPFMIEEWQAGNIIRLVKNPFYHRADEGLPASDILNFKFLSADDPASLLLAANAECDLVSSSALDLQDIQDIKGDADGYAMRLVEQLPDTVEMLAFGITPASYDDNYYPYGADRPDLFGDVRTRQAMAYCIDTDTIINKLLGGSVRAAPALLPADHPQMVGLILGDYSYDPQKGISLLESAGWSDADINPDTPISAVSVNNVPAFTNFEIELLTSEAPLRADIASEIASQLNACGIKVNITPLPLADIYQTGPDGPLFGRRFDLALLSMQIDAAFDCRLFKGSEIPAASNYWLGEMTGGVNIFGYRNPEYDAQCTRAIQSGLDREGASTAVKEMITILNNDQPVIPLFFHPRSILIKNGMCGIPKDSYGHDVFQNVEEIVMDDDCFTGN